MLLQTIISTTGGGVGINVITASSLPSIVVENQIVVITDTIPSTIYVDTDEPANPVSGDVWVQVGSSEYGVEFSETFRNGLIAAKQYINNVWQFLDGYVGILGVWARIFASFPAPGTPLADWTWADIKRFANSGIDPTAYFDVGDTKNLLLSTGEVITYVLGDFYRNTITGTNKRAALAFTPHPNCLADTYRMNTNATSVGGWDGSNFRNNNIPEILATFPQELLSDDGMKYVDVVAAEGNQSQKLIVSSDRLRPHSVTELGLSHSTAAVEGEMYAFYASGNRIKQINGQATRYYTRSPSSHWNDTFVHITVDGTTSHSNASANTYMGMALAFDL